MFRGKVGQGGFQERPKDQQPANAAAGKPGHTHGFSGESQYLSGPAPRTHEDPITGAFEEYKSLKAQWRAAKNDADRATQLRALLRANNRVLRALKSSYDRQARLGGSETLRNLEARLDAHRAGDGRAERAFMTYSKRGYELNERGLQLMASAKPPSRQARQLQAQSQPGPDAVVRKRDRVESAARKAATRTADRAADRTAERASSAKTVRHNVTFGRATVASNRKGAPLRRDKPKLAPDQVARRALAARGLRSTDHGGLGGVRLRPDGSVIVPEPSKGACLFRSVADGLRFHPELAARLEGGQRAAADRGLPEKLRGLAVQWLTTTLALEEDCDELRQTLERDLEDENAARSRHLQEQCSSLHGLLYSGVARGRRQEIEYQIQSLRAQFAPIKDVGSYVKALKQHRMFANQGAAEALAAALGIQLEISTRDDQHPSREAVRAHFGQGFEGPPIRMVFGDMHYELRLSAAEVNAAVRSQTIAEAPVRAPTTANPFAATAMQKPTSQSAKRVPNPFGPPEDANPFGTPLPEMAAVLSPARVANPFSAGQSPKPEAVATADEIHDEPGDAFRGLSASNPFKKFATQAARQPPAAGSGNPFETV